VPAPGRRIHVALALTATVSLALTLSIASGAAPLVSAQGSPIRPVTGPDGRVLRTLRQQVQSSNWSGYVVAHYETGQTYTAATATWVVPTVSLPPGSSAAYSSSWVGIGGFCLNSSCTKVDRTLIQLGTEQDTTQSGSQYYAWYETLPNPAVSIPGITISPGDTITASLQDGPSLRTPNAKPGPGKSSSETWTLTLTDDTTGATWSETLSYSSSLASAEWIEEAPTSGGSILPLADYGTVTFDPGTANGANPDLASSDGVVMLNPNGQGSFVSPPDGDTDGFDACFSPTHTSVPCSPPNS
jgi:hypothetical protein